MKNIFEHDGNFKKHLENGGYIAFTTIAGTTILSKKGMSVITDKQEEQKFWEEHPSLMTLTN